MSLMKSAWKMKKPKPKPSRYSAVMSNHIGNPSSPVIVAAMITPVASPATQWSVEPSACFHIGRMKPRARRGAAPYPPGRRG